MGKNLIFLGIGIVLCALLFNYFGEEIQSEPLIDDQTVILRAKELGMDYVNIIESNLREEILNELNSQIENNPESEEFSYLLIDIPQKASAGKIAEILEGYGFDGNEFLVKVTEQSKTETIRYGRFYVRSNASITDIIKILTN